MVNFEGSNQDNQSATKLVTLDQIYSNYRTVYIKCIVIDVVPFIDTQKYHYIK